MQPGGRTSVIIHNIDSAGKTHTLLLGPASLRQQGNNTLHKYSKTNTLLSKYSMTTQHFSAATFLLFSLLNSPQILQANIFSLPLLKILPRIFSSVFRLSLNITRTVLLKSDLLIASQDETKILQGWHGLLLFYLRNTFPLNYLEQKKTKQKSNYDFTIKNQTYCTDRKPDQ